MGKREPSYTLEGNVNWHSHCAEQYGDSFKNENRATTVQLLSRLCNPMDCSMPGFCFPLSPRVCSNSRSLSRWCYITISTSATPIWSSNPTPGCIFSENHNWKRYVHLVIHCTYAKLLQSCLTLCDAMNCTPPGSSVHGILQAVILEWVAMPSSRGSSWPRDQTCVSYVSCTGRRNRIFTANTTWLTHCTTI